MNTLPALSWLNAPVWLPLVHALLHTLWQGALGAGGLFLALRLVPAQRARLRYGLSATALALVVFTGVGSWALLDAPRQPPTNPVHHDHPSSVAAERLPEGLAFPAASGLPFASGGQSDPPKITVNPIANGTNASRAKAWVRWLAACWLLGVSASLLRAVKGTLGAGSLRRRSRDLNDARVLALAEELCARLGLGRRVRFLVSDEIDVPSMLGILYPAVLLPASLLTGVPLEQLRAILAHELAHVRRWDYLTNLAQMLVEALLFFNPFVWWISRQMRLEREACCDQVAAAECQSPACYVEALVAVIERGRLTNTVTPPILAASGPDARGGNALERARRLLVPGYQPAFRIRWFSLAAVLISAMLALGGLWWGTRAVAQTIQAPEGRAKSAKSEMPSSPTRPESFVATVSAADGTAADDDSATANIYESSGPNSGSTIAWGINQPGLIVNHQKGRFTLQPRADSRTLACAVTMQGYAATFAGPFAPPFKELENIHFTLRKGLTGLVQTVDEAGQPIAGALLIGYHPGPPRVELGEIKTDVSGIAALEHVSEAPLNVRVLADGFQGDEIKNLRFDPAKPYRWTLKTTRALPGIVTAADTGKPVAGATVKLAGVRGAMDETHGEPDKAPLLAKSDAQGRFALSSLRPDCRYYLFVEAPGYSGVYVRKLELSRGELQVSLGPERIARGKVIHIPDSAFFLDSVPLFYWQDFTFDDGGTFQGQRSLPLHPKSGEAAFSIGPFFVTQRGSLPTDTPGTEGMVAMHLENQREVRLAISDLPKLDCTYDLAEEPIPPPAPAARPDPTPTVPSGQSRDLADLESDQRDAILTTARAAIKAGDIQAIDGFLRRGLGVNATLVNSSSLLFSAVDDNQPAIVKLLLAHGANVLQKTSWGDVPLKRACWRGYRDIADALIQAGAPVNELWYATGLGDVSTLEARDQRQPITPKEARDHLFFAVASGHPGTFDFLWKKLGPLDDKAKDKLLGDLYENAGKWGHANMLPVLEALGATPARDGSRALTQAVIWNYPEAVKALLERDIPADPPATFSRLRNAAGDGHLEIVRLLLDHGANINVQDDHGFTPLSWAAYGGREDVCLLLLDRGADGRIKDRDGRNAAWHAAAGPHCAEALARMIKGGVPVTEKDKQGGTILDNLMHFSTPGAWRGEFFRKVYSPADIEQFNGSERRVVELLLAAGVDPNAGKYGLLSQAMYSNHYEAARVLLAHGANPALTDQNGDNALFALVSYVPDGPLPLDLFKALLKRDGRPNPETTAPGDTPPARHTLLDDLFAWASRNPLRTASFGEAVKVMLDGGATFTGVADTNAQALLQGAARGNLAAIEQSVRRGAPVSVASDRGWDALTVATALGYDDCANWLIDQGADVNGHHHEAMNSPLIFAVQRGRADLVDRLLGKGAKITDGYDALYWAVDQKNIRVFNALLQAGADPKAEPSETMREGGKTFTPQGAVILYLCIEKGLNEMAHTLLDKGANADPPNLSENRNLAYWAVSYDRPEILQNLLDHGANPLLKDDHGDSALDLARKFHPQLAPMLEEASKRKSAPAP